MPRSPNRRGLTLCAAAFVLAANDAGADPVADLRGCAGLGEDAARLACFDQIAAALAAPGFAGFGNAETPVFETPGPADLVYASEDALLVIYLLTEKGELVQNLLMGGVGEARYPLPPGRYRLQVDATGGWSVRVEAAQ